MPLSCLSCIAENDADAYSEPPSRQTGDHIRTERWWWDRYDEIAEHDYDLSPRCHHPKWQPSCLKSGNDSYTVEDSQANMVRLTLITFFPPAHSNG